MDPRLREGGGVPATQLAALAEVASGCLQQDPSARCARPCHKALLIRLSSATIVFMCIAPALHLHAVLTEGNYERFVSIAIQNLFICSHSEAGKWGYCRVNNVLYIQFR